MKTVTVTLKADMLESQEGTMLLRLQTGFGAPEVRVDTDKIVRLEYDANCFEREVAP